MPVTLESNRILIDTVEVETVKTHVPEVDIDIDIVPAITYPDTTTRNLQLAAESNTGVNGWRLVRFLPPNLGRWYSGNYFTTTNMEVSASLGTAYNYSNEFMVPFGTYDEIFFSTRDMTYWLRCLKTAVLGTYDNSLRPIISSSSSPTPYSARWYSRESAHHEPWITIADHNTGPQVKVYGENGWSETNNILNDYGGMCVFVRSSTVTISSSIIPAMPVYETQTTVTQNPLLPADSTNLVAWYKFDDDYNDSSGNGNNLTQTDTTLDTAFIGNGVYFDNTVDIVKTTNNFTSFDMNTTRTVSCWVKRTVTGATRDFIWAQGPFSAANQFGGTFAEDNKLTFYIYSHIELRPTNIFTNTGVFYHIVYTIGNGTAKIYVDGLEISSGSYTTANIPTSPLYIGKQGPGGSSSTCIIDDFRIYDKVLSAYEIDILANNKIENPDYKILTFEYNNEHVRTEGMAENATGVYGWSHVKHLNKNATQWYPDNTEEGRDFFTVADQVFDSHGSFTKPFPEHFDELLFTRSDGNGNVDRFVHCLKTDLETIIAHTNWTANITSIQTHSGPLSLFNGFGRLSSYANRAPMILSRNSSTNEVDYSVYEEHYQTTSANEGSPWWAPVANKQYDVYARMSIPVQTEYTVNFPEESECDILIVGGGGGGDSEIGGGGGGGAVLYARQVTIPANTYTIKVGRGGNQNEKGYSTEAFSAICLGGGTTPYGSWSSASHGNTGGSGGGGSVNGGSGGGVGTSTIGTFLTNNVKDSSYINLYNGYAGGNAGTQISLGGANPALSGGGGGAGESGNNGSITARYNNNSSYTNWVNDGSPGKGGDGVLVNITGHDYYWGAGGGGGSFQTLAGTGGKGGGGAGGQSGNEGTQSGGGDAINIGQNGGETATAYGGNGGQHTGSGGGGGGWQSTQGGNGGSGIVIIRYKTKYIRQHPAYDAQWTYHSTNPNVHHYGNVGIGTLASETNKLTVKGDMNMIGNYKQNDVNLGNWYSSDNIHNIHRLTGNVGIGKTDPQYSIDTTGVVYASHGGFTGGTSTNWATSSDERIKDNITSASNETCYENVKNINLYKFNYKEQFANNKNETQYGFIAQEVQKYYPKAVKYEKIKVKDDTYENFLTINQTQLNYTLFGAVKHLQLELENIKVKLGMVEPIQEEPVTEETNTTEEPVAEDTNTT